ncbi:MAG: hypothetical protein BroJett040_22050 [Oligoflexia bacterium]|nr:MAG: hypothetical protein BroJett040_22050 [Oligoflexia bacterium]
MKIIFAVFIFIFINTAQAAEFYEYTQSVRALGMGGVRVHNEDDAAVMLWNPAALAYITGINWTVFNLNAGINGMQIYNDIQAVGNINGIDSLSSFYGKNVWVGAGGYSVMAFPYFGFGLYDNGYGAFRLQDPAFPNMDITVLNDWGAIMGGAIPLGGAGSLGLNVKRVTRYGGNTILGPSDLMTVTNTTITNAITNEGIGYGLDLGYMFAPPVMGNPAISLSWIDVGSTAFNKTKGTQAPSRIKDNLTLGITSHGSLPGLGYATGLEYRHITDQGEPLGKKIHLGLELSLAFLDVRAGFYQGYITYGLGMDLWLMRLDLASYSVEKGAYPGQTQDERLQAALTIEIGFDPSFKLIDLGGKKRKLKQRR